MGLNGVSFISTVTIDHALVTALVERWRQETHTIHFVVGDTTFTFRTLQSFISLTMHD